MALATSAEELAKRAMADGGDDDAEALALAAMAMRDDAPADSLIRAETMALRRKAGGPAIGDLPEMQPSAGDFGAGMAGAGKGLLSWLPGGLAVAPIETSGDERQAFARGAPTIFRNIGSTILGAKLGGIPGMALGAGGQEYANIAHENALAQGDDWIEPYMPDLPEAGRIAGAGGTAAGGGFVGKLFSRLPLWKQIPANLGYDLPATGLQTGLTAIEQGQDITDALTDPWNAGAAGVFSLIGSLMGARAGRLEPPPIPPSVVDGVRQPHDPLYGARGELGGVEFPPLAQPPPLPEGFGELPVRGPNFKQPEIGPGPERDILPGFGAQVMPDRFREFGPAPPITPLAPEPGLGFGLETPVGPNLRPLTLPPDLPPPAPREVQPPNMTELARGGQERPLTGRYFDIPGPRPDAPTPPGFAPMEPLPPPAPVKTKKAKATEVPSAKEPWEMTREEYFGTGERLYKGIPKSTTEGEPLVDIDARKAGKKFAGYFTTKKEVAERFTKALTLPGYSHTIEATVKLDNPLIIDAKGKPAREFMVDALNDANNNASIIEEATRGKHDGIIIKNTSDEGDIHIPATGQQIKSSVFHRNAVERAVAEGKPVPENVLAEYGLTPPAPRKAKVNRGKQAVQQDVPEVVPEPVSTHGETLTRNDVVDILASQPNNKGKDKARLGDRWVASQNFTRMEIPIDAVGIASPAKGKSQTTGPIIVDKNIAEVGRFEGQYGAPPDVLVIDGKHRISEAKARGEKTIEAFVGDSVVPQMREKIESFHSNENAVNEAISAYKANPDGSTLRALRALLPKAEVEKIRSESRRPDEVVPQPAQQGEPAAPARGEGKEPTAPTKTIDDKLGEYARFHGNRATPYEGGRGIAVGSEGISHRLREGAVYEFRDAIRAGKTPDEAEQIAQKWARAAAARHKAQRPKDYNWAVWEGTADRAILEAKKLALEPQPIAKGGTPHEETPIKGREEVPPVEKENPQTLSSLNPVVEGAGKPAPAKREPWQMTHDEYVGEFNPPFSVREIQEARKKGKGALARFKRRTGPMVPPPISGEIEGKINRQINSAEDMKAAYQEYVDGYNRRVKEHFESVKKNAQAGKIIPKVASHYTELREKYGLPENKPEEPPGQQKVYGGIPLSTLKPVTRAVKGLADLAVEPFARVKSFLKRTPKGDLAYNKFQKTYDGQRDMNGHGLRMYEHGKEGLGHADRVWIKKNFKAEYEAGKKMPNPRIQKFADTWRRIAKYYGDMAERLGVIIHDPRGDRQFRQNIPNYIPRVWTQVAREAMEKQSGEVYDFINKTLGRKGLNPQGVDELSTMLHHEKRYGAAEKARIGYVPDTMTLKNGDTVKLLETNPFTLIETYIERMSKRLPVIRDWGQDVGEAKADKISQELKRIDPEAGEQWDVLWAALNDRDINPSILGHRHPKTRAGVSGAEATARAHMLSAMLVTNLSGPLPIMVKAGMRKTLKNLPRAIASQTPLRKFTPKTNAEIEFMREHDAFSENPLGYTFGTDDLEKQIGEVARVPLKFAGGEWINKVLNVLAGITHKQAYMEAIEGLRNPKNGLVRRAWGKDTQGFRNWLRREFDFSDMKIDRMIKTGVTDEDLGRVMRKATESTNLYKEGPDVRRAWMNDPIKRRVMSYTGYLRAMGNVMSDAHQSMKEGNVRPMLVLLGIAGPALGHLQGKLEDWLYRKEREPGFWKNLYRAYAEAGVTGLAGSFGADVVYAVRRGQAPSLTFPQAEWLWKMGESALDQLWKEAGKDKSVVQTWIKGTPLLRMVDAQMKGPVWRSRKENRPKKSGLRGLEGF